ncbi:hypothetical protein CNEO4_570030 [Clostridium neonatale]|nr:hypothetical protein CNEO4_570030 [Clostridium neonatale]
MLSVKYYIKNKYCNINYWALKLITLLIYNKLLKYRFKFIYLEMLYNAQYYLTYYFFLAIYCSF